PNWGCWGRLLPRRQGRRRSNCGLRGRELAVALELGGVIGSLGCLGCFRAFGGAYLSIASELRKTDHLTGRTLSVSLRLVRKHLCRCRCFNHLGRLLLHGFRGTDHLHSFGPCDLRVLLSIVEGDYRRVQRLG